jgi:TusA-related sulfurtransferase
MDDIHKIDACGLSSPQPALLTHKAIESKISGTVQVLVDSTTARDSVIRTAQRAGWQVSLQTRPDGVFQISLTK